MARSFLVGALWGTATAGVMLVNLSLIVPLPSELIAPEDEDWLAAPKLMPETAATGPDAADAPLSDVPEADPQSTAVPAQEDGQAQPATGLSPDNSTAAPAEGIAPPASASTEAPPPQDVPLQDMDSAAPSAVSDAPRAPAQEAASAQPAAPVAQTPSTEGAALAERDGPAATPAAPSANLPAVTEQAAPAPVVTDAPSPSPSQPNAVVAQPDTAAPQADTQTATETVPSEDVTSGPYSDLIPLERDPDTSPPRIAPPTLAPEAAAPDSAAPQSVKEAVQPPQPADPQPAPPIEAAAETDASANTLSEGAVPETPAAMAVPALTDDSPADRAETTPSDRLPRIAALPDRGAEEGPTIGKPVIPLAERLGTVGTFTDRPAAAEPPAPPPPAWIRNGAVAEGQAPQGPLLGMVLIDPGLPEDLRAGLLEDPLPITIALDSTREDAPETLRQYRTAGYEVLVIPGPAGDAATLAALPDAVGLLSATDAPVPSAGVLSADGHGVLLWPGGLDGALRGVARAGLPALRAYRLLDGQAERAPVIGRYLGRAAFEAQQTLSETVIGHLYPETLQAVRGFVAAAPDRGIAVVPVTVVMARQIDDASDF